FVIWVLGGIPDHPLHSFAASLLYVRNLVGRGHETDHLWSLSLEEQFYVLWPLVLVAFPSKHRLRLAIASGLFIGITAWRVYAGTHALVSQGVLYNRSDFRFDGPLLGCALALAECVAPNFFSALNGSLFRSTSLVTLASLGLAVWIGFK